MRRGPRLGLIALLIFLAFGVTAIAQTPSQDRARANVLWQQALALYGQGKKTEALTAFRDSLRLWSDEVRKSYVARLEEGRAAETSTPPPPNTPRPATALPTTPPPTTPKPTAPIRPTPASTPATTTPAPSKIAAPSAMASDGELPELIPLAPGATISVGAPIATQVRQILAPFGKALHFAGKATGDEPTTLRAVFTSFDGEFLELLMGVDAAGAVTVGDVSVVSLGHDAARVARVIAAYRIG